MQLERIQKILARAGIASRRKAEELIANGEVSVNGKVAKLGDKAEFGRDSIKVRGRLIFKVEPMVYLAFNKPKGVITHSPHFNRDLPLLLNVAMFSGIRIHSGNTDNYTEGCILVGTAQLDPNSDGGNVTNSRIALKALKDRVVPVLKAGETVYISVRNP